MADSLTIAIVGRPNVGKSTLFNRLAGARRALVDDRPGVTRDRRYGEGRLGPLPLRLIDTAGLESPKNDDTLEARMMRQTEAAVREADVILLMVDGRAGITPADEAFAAQLRRYDTPLAVLVNKAEGSAAEHGVREAWRLGLGDPVPISAEHGEGLAELYETLAPYAPEDDDTRDGEEPEGEDATPASGPLKLAIMGRPNAGKSTLMNALLGEDRVLTGPEAGITRDAIYADWEFEGRPIRLVDTAGLRRKSHVRETLEKLSVSDALYSLRFAEVAVLLMDAAMPLEKQDLVIAGRVLDEGRALVLAVNKWDTVSDPEDVRQAIRDRLERSLPEYRDLPLVCCSALTGKGIRDIIRTALAHEVAWNTRISTAKLNRWLAGMTEAHPPPLGTRGRRIKLRYMTQIKARPPTFHLFCSQPKGLPDSYLRYLKNGLRDTFHLSGIPLRLVMRKGDNPYD